jgi:hypothetical protein
MYSFNCPRAGRFRSICISLSTYMHGINLTVNCSPCKSHQERRTYICNRIHGTSADLEKNGFGVRHFEDQYYKSRNWVRGARCKVNWLVAKLANIFGVILDHYYNIGPINIEPTLTNIGPILLLLGEGV